MLISSTAHGEVSEQSDGPSSPGALLRGRVCDGVNKPHTRLHGVNKLLGAQLPCPATPITGVRHGREELKREKSYSAGGRLVKGAGLQPCTSGVRATKGKNSSAVCCLPL